MSFITALVGSALAAGDSNLQPTAHPNVKRTYSTPPTGVTTQSLSLRHSGSGSLTVHLDEQGRPTQDVKASRSAVQIPAYNHSHRGLVTRPVQSKDGRIVHITDLEGRFQSYAVGTIGPDGLPLTGCIGPRDIITHNNNSLTSGCQEKCCK